ncbi:amidohydrolase family protein [Stakelama saccharophila]|uniref:Amidohydrolase family protein n=1 Tax=Stakelama saccharophila TaxID=3075605 RepID=A0ABZ0BBA0_9SPHN|nr:amidohydrolase family protein [Stakelama sp. W311]WNO54559.1 amidohydrolase family protein [Stakelama sp. W311]
MKHPSLLLIAAAATAAMAMPAAAQDVAITHARLVIGDGSAPIEDGTVVVRAGRVVAAGAGVSVPAGMDAIDAGGRWVTPGIVAGFTRLGIVEVDGVRSTDDSAAGDSPFHASLDVAPAVNPLAMPVEINRAAGITRAVVAPATSDSIFAGQGAVIDLGRDRDAITKRHAFQFMEYGEDGAQEAGGSRPAAFAMFRNALLQARDYARDPDGYADQGKDALVNAYDAKALMPVAEGEVPLLVHVERASDILALLDLKRELPKLKLVLVGASEGWTVADRIAAAGVPVIASALNDLPAAFEKVAATQSNVGRMQAAGVTVALGTINDNDARQARHEKQYAGNLVALTKVPGATGLRWDQAFASITSGAAEAIGMADQIGSLRPGRHGDVVIWSGDPLELDSVAQTVFIDGVKQPLETRQDKLRQRYMQPTEGSLPNAYER